MEKAEMKCRTLLGREQARLRTVNPGESGTANQEARGVLQK